MPSIGTRLFTLLRGREVGVDQFGNHYYEDKRKPAEGERRKRWVIYKGRNEATKVPAIWHGWLHYSTDEVPAGNEPSYAWEKPHLPNLTGTNYAYRPPGHMLRGGKRDAATGDYEPWRP